MLYITITIMMHESLQNSRGEPFGTSDSWTKYIQSIFKQLAIVAISSNALRSSFVTDLLTHVLRVHPDKREVLLGHLVQQSSSSTAGRSKTYRLRIGGGTWIEPFDSLVYPVDMTYNTSSCVLSRTTRDYYALASPYSP